MKIAVNTRVLLSTRMEGVCRYIHEVLRRMVLANPEDEFYFFFDRKFDPKFIYADNVKPIVLSPQARHPFLWYWWFEHSVPRALKKYNIDVFYSGDTYMSLKTNVPTVLVSHDIAYAHFPEHISSTNLHLQYYRKYFPKFHRKAEKVIAVSNFTRKDIIKQYDLPEDKVIVGHNAQKEGLKALNKNERIAIRNKFTNGKEYFLYLGSIHPRKNVENLIIAFNKFKEQTGSDKKLVLVGRLAWNIEKYKQAIDESKFKHDIIHLSGANNEDAVLLTASAHAMVYVSLFEGFGLPILEAFHCEVPVICSNISSMPEVAGKAAILVDPFKTDTIAEALISLDANEELRQQLILAGKTQRNKFDWDKTVYLTYNALKNAVKN